MKLEDATKEELVWWIKEHSFALSFRPSEFEADIMRHRHDVYMEKADKCGEQYDEALKSYQTLLTPYLGKPLGLLPKDVLDQGARLEKTMNAAQRERMRLWNLANKCMDRVLGALDGGGADA